MAAATVSRRHALLGVASAVLLPRIASAEEEMGDLEAPSVVEVKSADDEAAAEKARIARKLAAQEKKTKTSSLNMSYKTSMEQEDLKRKEIKSKTKEERQAELCEVLGRGC